MALIDFSPRETSPNGPRTDLASRRVVLGSGRVQQHRIREPDAPRPALAASACDPGADRSLGDAAGVLTGLTRWSCLAFVGLPGRIAEIFCAAGGSGRPGFGDGPPGCLPWLLDRDPVDFLDVAVGAYRPAEIGRSRAQAVLRRRARSDPRTLPCSGSRPEQALVGERAGRPRHGAAAADGGPRRRPTRPSLQEIRDRELVRGFDLVVQTLPGPTAAEWDLPLSPDTPVLQCVRRADGDVAAVSWSGWADRLCRCCLLDLLPSAPPLPVSALAEIVARDRTGPTGLEDLVAAPPPSPRAVTNGARLLGRRLPGLGPTGNRSPECLCRLGAGVGRIAGGGATTQFPGTADSCLSEGFGRV